MCREESAEAIIARTTTGEGPNFMLRTGTLAVRVTGDAGGRAGMRGAGEAGTGRNLADSRTSASRRPLAGGLPVAEQVQIMERVVERSNMQTAYRRVKQNKGAPGVDAMSVDELGDFLRAHWPTIKEWLLEGSYEPRPVRRVQIPKANGGLRPLGIPTVLDRLIQQALHQVLSPLFEPEFSRAQLRVSPGAQRPPGGAASTPVPAGRKTLGGGHGLGAVFRRSQSRHAHGADRS